MRLNEKTNPCHALGYPQRKLLKKTEYKIRKAKLKKEQLAQNKLAKEARARALQLIAAQPELGDGSFETGGLVQAFSLPHSSHKIVELHGDNSTIFCAQCSWWSSRVALR